MLALPPTFRPTHETGGLPGFPAVDVFGSPYELVRSSFWGIVDRISGRSPALGGRPGGAYGWSIYVVNSPTGTIRFMTHFHELALEVGDQVKPGTILGTIADSAISGKPGTSHIHLGMKSR